MIMGGCKQPGKLNDSWLDFFCSLLMVCTKDRKFPASYATLPERRCLFEKMLIFVGKVSQSISDILEELERSYGVDFFQVCHQENHRVIYGHIFIFTYRERERVYECLCCYLVFLFSPFLDNYIKNASSYMSLSTSLLNFFNFTYVFCWCVSVDWSVSFS